MRLDGTQEFGLVLEGARDVCHAGLPPPEPKLVLRGIQQLGLPEFLSPAATSGLRSPNVRGEILAIGVREEENGSRDVWAGDPALPTITRGYGTIFDSDHGTVLVRTAGRAGVLLGDNVALPFSVLVQTAERLAIGPESTSCETPCKQGERCVWDLVCATVEAPEETPDPCPECSAYVPPSGPLDASLPANLDGGQN